jgi:hypothetical protein
MGLIPAPWPVLHTPRGVEAEYDAHGNERIVDGDPVIRYVIALYQNGYKTGMASKTLFTEEYLNEVQTDLQMVITHADIVANVFGQNDKVLVGGAVVGGVYEGGTAFRLMGVPGRDVEGPWPYLYKHFGGLVRLRRSN